MKEKLAIIRADIPQQPLILKAKELGIETHCFAWDKDDFNDCKNIADYFHPISILEKEQILEKCKEIKIDGITSITNDFAVTTVAYIAENMRLPGNRYEDMVIAAGNKFSQRQAFHEQGVNSPRFAIAREGLDLTEFQYPLIVKPVDRNGSIGVKKVDNEAELQKAIQQAQQVSFSKEVIVEEFVFGCEATLDMISYQGEHYPIIISDTEIMGHSDFTKKGYHQPTQLNIDIQTKIIAEAKKALDALKFEYGASDTEVMVTDSGEVKVIEINPRMGGDATEQLIRLSTGYDFIKGVIDVALGQFEKPVFPYKNFSGIHYFSEYTDSIRQTFENKEYDPNIVKAILFSEEEKHYGRIGYIMYQSDRKKRWD